MSRDEAQSTIINYIPGNEYQFTVPADQFTPIIRILLHLLKEVIDSTTIVNVTQEENTPF
jgi:hypothetical protein